MNSASEKRHVSWWDKSKWDYYNIILFTTQWSLYFLGSMLFLSLSLYFFLDMRNIIVLTSRTPYCDNFTNLGKILTIKQIQTTITPFFWKCRSWQWIRWTQIEQKMSTAAALSNDEKEEKTWRWLVKVVSMNCVNYISVMLHQLCRNVVKWIALNVIKNYGIIVLRVLCNVVLLWCFWRSENVEIKKLKQLKTTSWLFAQKWRVLQIAFWIFSFCRRFCINHVFLCTIMKAVCKVPRIKRKMYKKYTNFKR